MGNKGANGLEERVAAPKEIVAEKCENLKKPEEIKKEAEKGGGVSSHKAEISNNCGKKVVR